MTKTNYIKQMTFCAVSVALAVVANMITFTKMPFGGSVTLFSMLIIVLPAWFYGVRMGCACGLVYGLLQFVTGPYFLSPIQFFLDYILAFSIMGIAGFFKDSNHGLLKGYALAVLGRWVVATWAGLEWVKAGSTVWDGWAPLPYSIAYNATYIIPEAALTLVLLMVPAMQSALNHIKAQATSERAVHAA